MAKNFEIHEDIVAGLIPYLSDPETLKTAHQNTQHYDPLLHLTHQGLVATASRFTGLDPDHVNAIDVGATVYEALAATNNTEIPGTFVVEALATRRVDPNFSLRFGQELQDWRGKMIIEYPFLAQGIYNACVGVLGEGSEDLASVYALGAAGVMRGAYRELVVLWDTRQLVDGPGMD